MKINRLKKVVKTLLVGCLCCSLFTLPSKVEATDTKATIASITASSYHSTRPASKMIDGDTTTFWETDWNGDNHSPTESNPIVVTALLAEPINVSIIKMTPRQGSNLPNGDGNGRFLKARYTYLDTSGNAISDPFTITYASPPSADAIQHDVYQTIGGLKIEVLDAYAAGADVTATMAELEIFAQAEVSEDTQIQLNVTSVSTNSAHTNSPVTNVIDGNTSTFWETAWNEDNHSPTESTPMILTASLNGMPEVSFIRITPRQGSNLTNGDGNGRYLKARYTYLDTSGNAIGDSFTVSYDSPPSQDPIVLEVNQAIGGIKIEVLDAYSIDGNVTATTAELEFFYIQKVTLDTSALEAKINEAIALDTTGKSSASINALYQMIDTAKEVVKNPTSSSQINNTIADLERAMELEVADNKDVINLSGNKDLERETNFNEGWLFRETTDDSFASVLDESQFTSINLPHDFSIDNEFSTSGEAESGYLLGGTGWYRKHFVLPESANGKQISLNFDGSYMDTYIYVNEQFVAEHHNGYSQFTVDLSDYVVADGTTENVIAIKVVNTIPSSRWYSGSGIYRDVTLFVKDSTHIKQDGLFVHSENVSSSSATVIVENEIENPRGQVVTTIYDKNGNEVATNSVTASANTRQSFTISNPELWSVDTYTPALYTVKSEIKDGETIIDSFSDVFGIKSISFDVNNGFYLNGEALKLKGVCMHHDQGALGARANYHAIYRQVKTLKDMGTNSIRVTHNPASEVLLDVCDELGVIVINEMFDGLYHPKNGNSNDFSKWFNQSVDAKLMDADASWTWAEYSARQTVRMSRNHASVILYSIGNEIQEGVYGYDCSGFPAKIREICTWMKDEDPYTLPTVGSNWLKSNDSIAIQYSTIIAEEFGGPIGFNYATTSQMQSIRSSHPTWVVYGSETSSAHHSRDVYYTQGSDQTNKLTTDYENEDSRAGWGHSASTAWKIATETTWNMGEYVWTGFDYIGEPTPWNNTNAGGSFPAARSSTFGIIETNGLWKDIAYLYHSFWNDDERTLHVTDSWTANMGSTVLVQVFSDADKVELYLNGSKVGEDTSTVQANGDRYFSNSKFHAEFNVPYAAGTISAKAYDLVDGNYVEVSDTVGVKEVTTPGTATTTTLKADREELASDGYELAYVEINVVDANGNICTEFNNTVNISVEGEGNIVGVDSGKQSEMQSYRIDNPKSHTKAVFNGKLIAIIQSTKRAGEITVNVSGSGLAAQSITLNAVPVSDSTEITSVEYVSKYAIFEGETLELPQTVSAVQENGAVVEKAVTWDTTTVNTNVAGIYTAKGTIDGVEATLNASVTVYAPVAAAENYSALYHEGSNFELPSETVVYYKDGTKAGNFPIQWKYYDEDEFTSGNIVTIQGSVTVASKTMNMYANIRVLDPLPTKTNYARKADDLPTISQSCTNIADNINSLNNGVTNNSSSTNERWTDWNQQGDQVVWVQYEWNNKYTFGDMVAYMWMDSNGCQEPKNMDYSIQYKNDAGLWVPVQITYITPVAYYDGDGKTTFDFLQPVTTNGLRLTMDKRQTNIFTGMTELEANEYVAKEPSETNATMTSVNMEGNVVDTSSATSFDITTDTPIADISIADVNVAATATYVTLRDDTTNTLRIIVRAEDGSNQTYVFNIQAETPVVDKTPLENKINEALAIEKGEYSQASYDALQAAITTAQNALNTVTTNQEVSAAVAALQSAIDGLKVEIDTSALQNKINEALAIAQDDYTQASYQALQTAITTAQNALTTVTTVEEVNAAVTALQNAIDALVALPQPVTNLAAQGTTYKSIQLTWDAQSDAQYEVYRQNTVTKEWILLTTTTEATYTVNGVKTGKEYTYKVITKKTIDGTTYTSDASNEVKCTATLMGEVVLTLNNNGQTRFDLTWEPVDGATRYIIYRKSTTSEYKKILTLGKDARTYTSFSMAPGTYTYQVKAARYDGEDRVMTNGSNEVVGISDCDTPVLTLTKVDNTSVQLSWQAVEGLNYYEIYRAGSDGAFRRWKVTSDTTIINKSLKSGTYTYRLRGYRVHNGIKAYSNYSNEESITLE